MPQGPTQGLTGFIVRPTVTDGTNTVKEVREIDFPGGTVAAGPGFGEVEVTFPAAPSARNLARLTAQWVSGATVADDTVFMLWSAPYAGTINSATYFTGVGSFDCAIEIAAANALSGTPVTGLGALSVSSDTPTTTNATALNTFAAGQNILAVLTSASSGPAPTDAVLNLDITWAS
jgi:hypothetical protein